MKKAVIAGVIGVIFVSMIGFIFSRTTTDLGEARARMNETEQAFLTEVLVRIRPTSNREELRQLLGPPYTDTPWGIEWKAPVFPGRIRVYFENDGRRIRSIAWRKLGWFDVRFKPWELEAG